MTKRKNDARTHHQFTGKPVVFVVRYDLDLLAKIKTLANRNNESINKTINDLCEKSLFPSIEGLRLKRKAFHEQNESQKLHRLT